MIFHLLKTFLVNYQVNNRAERRKNGKSSAKTLKPLLFISIEIRFETQTTHYRLNILAN
jgi:hypothetical protein